jgi:multidrug efflux pump subunit AcrA (membrane-fusion protein)
MSANRIAVIVLLTLVLGLLVGAVSWAIARGPIPRRSGVLGRAAVAVAVAVVVGELASVVIFSGSIDRLLDERAARAADSTPAVAAASAQLDRTRQARTALDAAVEEASRQREAALVVARCEYHPSPACPQTHITGVPGTGPETRTATDFLAETQRELDNAVANRDRVAPGLDSEIAGRERALEQVRTAAMKDVDHGLGARWMAMNDHTFASPGAMLLRLATIAFFALLIVLPLILKLWRGQTSENRGAVARAEVERAEVEADTAIAVKRAEVRAAVETLWAEQQLASARLAVEAQTEIDREQHRRRVIEAIEAPVQAHSERVPVPTPELTEGNAVEPRREGSSLIPTIPDVTKAAARWLRPFVPPIIASAIDTTTKPLRSARQVFEETEEIHFSLKRTYRVSVQSEEDGPVAAEPVEPHRPPASVVSSVERHQMLTGQEGHPSLRGADGPRQLPPAK